MLKGIWKTFYDNIMKLINWIKRKIFGKKFDKDEKPIIAKLKVGANDLQYLIQLIIELKEASHQSFFSAKIEILRDRIAEYENKQPIYMKIQADWFDKCSELMKELDEFINNDLNDIVNKIKGNYEAQYYDKTKIDQIMADWNQTFPKFRALINESFNAIVKAVKAAGYKVEATDIEIQQAILLLENFDKLLSDESAIEIMNENSDMNTIIDKLSILCESYQELDDIELLTEIKLPFTNKHSSNSIGFTMKDILSMDISRVVNKYHAIINEDARHIINYDSAKEYELLYGKPFDEILKVLEDKSESSMVGTGTVSPLNGHVYVTAGKQDYSSFHVDNKSSERYKLHYKLLQEIWDNLKDDFKWLNKGYELILRGDPVDGIHQFEIIMDKTIASDVYNRLMKNRNTNINERYNSDSQTNPAINKAKESINVLAANIISSKGNVTQTSLNKIADVINNNGLLEKWSKGFRSVSLKLVNNTNEISFVLPSKMDTNFQERFIDGKETLNDFLRRSGKITIELHSNFFKKLKKREQLGNVIEKAIKFYDRGMDKVSLSIMRELLRAKPEIRKLIVTTPLRATIPMALMILCTPDKINIDDPDFEPSQQTINTVKRFIRSVVNAANASKEEQKQLVADMKQAIVKLTAGRQYTEMISNIFKLPDAIQSFCEGEYTIESTLAFNQWELEQRDLKIISEAPKVKRLKKIPADLVAYVIIEGEAVRDANDKMLIVSYAYGKLEIIDWYIELIDANSPNYIVPHSKEYLINIKRQLLAAINTIMARRLPSPNDPIVRVNYPKGYEG